MYAVSSNDNSKLEPVVPHIFGDHSICIDAAWCTYHKNPSAYSYKHLSKGQPLSGDQLRKELDHIASNLQYMMQHINKLGSTQSNENFNNIVASKAPKNRSYGGTQSFFARVSAAVLQKNIGYSYIEKVNEDAQLSPGNFSRKHGILMDKKKLWNKKKHATISYKRKRITLKKRKHEKESTKYLKEGITYESNICNTETDQYDIQPIPGKRTFTGKEDMIVFDLETTGLSRCSDIIQLAAFDGKEDLNVYIYPSQPITRKASEITGISFNYNTQQMFTSGRQVDCVDIRLGLLKLIEYVAKHQNPILVGHNISAFDIPILCKKLQANNLLSEFLHHINGCLDTLKLARRLFSKEMVTNYKQQTLVQTLLGKSYRAHDALEDVKNLYELFIAKFTYKPTDVFAFNFQILQKSFMPIVTKKLISNACARKLANSGLCLEHLHLAYCRDSHLGIKSILLEHGFNSKTCKTIQSHFEHEE